MNENKSSPSFIRVATVCATLLFAVTSEVRPQTPSDDARTGPYDRLVIANARIIPGHGGPGYGPADIVIEDGRIVYHREVFDLRKCSGQALGLPGKLFGWSPPMKAKIRGGARESLSRFQDETRS